MCEKNEYDDDQFISFLVNSIEEDNTAEEIEWLKKHSLNLSKGTPLEEIVEHFLPPEPEDPLKIMKRGQLLLHLKDLSELRKKGKGSIVETIQYSEETQKKSRTPKTHNGLPSKGTINNTRSRHK